jgi:hypothetical protein
MKAILWYWKFIKRFIKAKRYWAYHRPKLVAIKSMEEFHAYVEETKPETFLFYKDKSEEKRKDFKAVVDYLKINLSDQQFLDIGPAYGDSLDICYEGGAKSIDFIEVDPFFFTYNRLKPFTKGFNHNQFHQLKTLERKKYTFIWVKGAFSADRFIQMKIIFHLSDWLAKLELLASPIAKIIICPSWKNNYHIRRIEDVYHNYFTSIMLQNGYKILPSIKSHNKEPEYPITYYKNMSLKPEFAEIGMTKV